MVQRYEDHPSAPSGRLNQPYQKLIGFAKTQTLACGAEETLEITVPVEDPGQL